MGFADLSEFYDPSLELTIRKKLYVVPAASAADGLRLRQLLSTPNLVMSDEQELEEITRLLGAHWEDHTERLPAFGPDGTRQLDDDGAPAFHDVEMGRWVGGIWEAMSNDGVTLQEIMHVGRTAMLKEAFNRDAAENYWAEALAGRGDLGNVTPPEPTTATGDNRKTRRTAAKKATSSKAPTGSTTRAPARTAKTTPAAARGSKPRKPAAGTTAKS